MTGPVYSGERRQVPFLAAIVLAWLEPDGLAGDKFSQSKTAHKASTQSNEFEGLCIPQRPRTTELACVDDRLFKLCFLAMPTDQLTALKQAKIHNDNIASCGSESVRLKLACDCLYEGQKRRQSDRQRTVHVERMRRKSCKPGFRHLALVSFGGSCLLGFYQAMLDYTSHSKPAVATFEVELQDFCRELVASFAELLRGHGWEPF